VFEKIPYWLKNKYALTFLFVTMYILFFDQNDIITQLGYQKELNSLKKDKEFYEKEILKTKTELQELTSNPQTLEKFAREKYYMKKDKEQIFIFSIKHQ